MNFIRRYGHIFQNARMFYLLCFVLAYCRISFSYSLLGDDIAYVGYTEQYKLLDYLILRYTTWTSRIFVEFFLYVFSMLPIFVWKFFISLCFVGCGVGLSYLIKAQTFLQRMIIFLSVIAVPNIYLNDAGWLVTTVSYVFFVVLSILALCSIRDEFDSKPIGIAKFVAYTSGALLAANFEQCCLILGVFFLGSFFYFYHYHKHISYILLIQLMCVFLEIILFLASPGNENRFYQEVHMWWFGFHQESYLLKVLYGIQHFLDLFFFDYYALCLLFLLITALLAGAYFVQQKKYCLWLWGTSFLVFISMILLRQNNTVYINRLDEPAELGYYYLMPLGLMIYLLTASFIYFGHKSQFYFFMFLLGIGVASMLIVCFSPTLFASRARIFICFIYVMLFLLLWYFVKYGSRVPYFSLVIFLFDVFWLMNIFC